MTKKSKQEDKDALQRDVTPLDICRYDYRKHIFRGFFDTVNDSVEFTPSGWGTGETTDLTKKEFKHFAKMVQRMYQDILALEDKYGDSDAF